MNTGNNRTLRPDMQKMAHTYCKYLAQNYNKPLKAINMPYRGYFKKDQIKAVTRGIIVLAGNRPWTINWAAERMAVFRPRGTLQVGLDMRCKGAQRTAAMVWSTDEHFGAYNSVYWTQHTDKIEVEGAQKKAADLCAQFKKRHGAPPRHVVIWRNNVPINQVDVITKREIEPMADAIKRAGGSLTYICVQDRSNVRVFGCERGTPTLRNRASAFSTAGCALQADTISTR